MQMSFCMWIDSVYGYGPIAMKFELEPDNRNCADDLLLEDLRTVASRLGEMQLSRNQYEKLGRFSGATVRKRFGGWNQALEKAGLKATKSMNVSKEQCLLDLRRVAASLAKSTVTREEYLEYGRFSERPFVRLFGSWSTALVEAGLDLSRQGRRGYSKEKLFEILESVWRTIGRQPRQSDLREPLSPVGPSAFTNRFGSWRAALEKFIEHVSANEGEANPTAEKNEKNELSNHDVDTGEYESSRRTPRNPSWRLRFLVMRRDGFKCCICGRNPAASHGLVLELDHIIPWSKGGETVMDNLQTLCQEDNGGKSDLPMMDDKDL